MNLILRRKRWFPFFSNHIVLLAIMLLAGFWCGATGDTNSQKQSDDPPNILFVISDDQSWPHAGAYGAEELRTPAFDRVAREGVLFINAFAAAPQCSPNRAAILTGRNIGQLEEAGTHASNFPKKFTVFPDLLEAAGYQIGYTGKGILKVEIATEGRYRISLRRYPRESGLSFNESVPAQKETIEISRPMPASNPINLEEATLYLGNISGTKPITNNAEEVSFAGYLSAGKYDMTAILKDDEGRVYPSYYTYIEKL